MTNTTATTHPTGTAALPAGTNVSVDGQPGWVIVTPANGTQSMVVGFGPRSRPGPRGGRRIVALARVSV